MDRSSFCFASLKSLKWRKKRRGGSSKRIEPKRSDWIANRGRKKRLKKRVEMSCSLRVQKDGTLIDENNRTGAKEARQIFMNKA